MKPHRSVKLRNVAKTVLLILPFFYLGFLLTDRYGLWDNLSGLSWSDRSEQRFEKSYARDSSIRVRSGDKAWMPTLKLIRKYSKANLQPDRESKVIARWQAALSTRTPTEGPIFSEWTAPSTPIVLLYEDLPMTADAKLDANDWVVVGTIGEWREWIVRAREERRFVVLNVFLGTFGPLLSIFVFLLERQIPKS